MSIHEECGVFGVYFLVQEDLIACHHGVPEISRLIGAEPLDYMPLEGLQSLCGGDGYCDDCFSGHYPTAIQEDTRKDQFEQRLSQRRKERG